MTKEENDEFTSIGLETLKNGEVAAIIMSGGQGTRLGFNGPKGKFPIGPHSKKTIFQIHIEKILKLSQLINDKFNIISNIPVYLMTSELNHEDIVQFFEENNFFNYPKKNIIFFKQNLIPSFDFDNKIILESSNTLSLSPDGNGGIYKALLQSGCFDDMGQRNVKYLHIYGVDNLLTKALDPIFIGYSVKNQLDISNKVVWRLNAAEKVGITIKTKKRNTFNIIEYSDVTKRVDEKTINKYIKVPVDPNDPNCKKYKKKLLYGAGNICNHFFRLDFILQKVLPNLNSIYHLAKKKIPYYDPEEKKTIKVTDNNGYKLEMFIFDIFPLANKWGIYEISREQEFAPVKNEENSPSGDCPNTARVLLSNLHKRWLKAQGAILINTEEEAEDEKHEETEDTDSEDEGKTKKPRLIKPKNSLTNLCEISPLVSYFGEGLEKFKDQEIKLPFYLDKA